MLTPFHHSQYLWEKNVPKVIQTNPYKRRTQNLIKNDCMNEGVYGKVTQLVIGVMTIGISCVGKHLPLLEFRSFCTCNFAQM